MTPASKAQREKVRDQTCIHCNTRPVDPAHLIPRSLLTKGQEEPEAVIALCRSCHREYDQGQLDILPSLERFCRQELAYAVERFGLLRTLSRTTNRRWSC